jgi:hypothetical protein
MEVEGIKENLEGVNSSMIYLIHFKNFCKCHNVSPPSTIKKNKKIQALEYYIGSKISQLILFVFNL